MSVKEKWIAPISTTAHNNIGLIQVRQDNVNSETWNIPIVQNGQEFDMTAHGVTQVFFTTNFKQQSTVERRATIVDAKRGIIQYTMDEQDMQFTGLQSAYFKFYDRNGTYKGTTQAFTYRIIKSIDREPFDSETYIVRLEELFIFYQRYMEHQMGDFEKFFEDYREVLESMDPNGILLKEITDSKGDYDSISERLNAMEDDIQNSQNFDMNDEIMGGIRSIFNYNIKKMEDDLALRTSNINIGHITDTHYVVRSKYWGEYPASSFGVTHLLNIGKLSNNLDLIISGGDNCDENTDVKQHIINLQKDYATTLSTVSECPFFIGIGNHDDNSVHSVESAETGTGTSFLVTDTDFKNLYFQNVNLFGEVRNNASNYYYYDIPNSNIRQIWIDLYQNPTTLNTSKRLKYPRIDTSIIKQDQLKWLIENAFNTNRDCIVFGHLPLKGSFLDYPTSKIFNHDLIYKVIRDFNDHQSGVLRADNEDFPVNLNYDFKSKTGRVIAYVCGHKHRDDYLLKDGLNFVITTHSVGGLPSGENYWYTNYEDSWSVISVNEALKQVEVIKFGRGTPITFNYGGV